jgi:hypothetical protein
MRSDELKADLALPVRTIPHSNPDAHIYESLFGNDELCDNGFDSEAPCKVMLKNLKTIDNVVSIAPKTADDIVVILNLP